MLLQVRSGFGCDPEAAGLVGDVLPGIGTSPLHHHGEAAIKLSGQNINYVKQVVRSWEPLLHDSSWISHFEIIFIIFLCPISPPHCQAAQRRCCSLNCPMGVCAGVALQGLHCDSRLRTDAESIFLSSPALKNWKPSGFNIIHFLLWALKPTKIGKLWHFSMNPFFLKALQPKSKHEKHLFSLSMSPSLNHRALQPTRTNIKNLGALQPIFVRALQPTVWGLSSPQWTQISLGSPAHSEPNGSAALFPSCVIFLPGAGATAVASAAAPAVPAPAAGAGSLPPCASGSWRNATSWLATSNIANAPWRLVRPVLVPLGASCTSSGPMITTPSVAALPGTCRTRLD